MGKNHCISAALIFVLLVFPVGEAFSQSGGKVKMDEWIRIIEKQTPSSSGATDAKGEQSKSKAVSPGAPPTQEEDFEALKERAYARLKNKDYQGAIGDFSKLIERYPGNPAYLNNRGAAKKNINDLEGARADFTAALKVDPTYEMARKNLDRLPQPAGQAQKPADATSDSKKPAPIKSGEQAPPAKVSAPADAIPIVLKEPLDIKTLTATQYSGAASAATESLRLIMGDLSPAEEKKFNERWAPHFDFPTEETVNYFNKLNPLLVEFLSLRAAVATAAVEFDAAWEEAVNAAGFESEDGIREALSIAELQKNHLLATKARLEQIVAAVKELGNPPDARELKAKKKKKHEEAMKTAKKTITAKKKEDKKKSEQSAKKDEKISGVSPASSPTAPVSAKENQPSPKSVQTSSPEAASSTDISAMASKAASPTYPAYMDKAAAEKLSATQFSSDLSAKDIERIKNEIAEGKIIAYYYCRSDLCVGRCGGLPGLTSRDGKYVPGGPMPGECSPEAMAKGRRLCKYHGKIIGSCNLNPEARKLLPPPPKPVEVQEVATGEVEEDDELPATDEEKAKRENITFHQANIKIIERNMAKDQAELAVETDSVRRGALQFRIITAQSDIQAEKDLIASLETGQIVHTRTPFDDYARDQFIVNIRENQRRMEDFQRTTAALSRLAGMLPPEESDQARDFIKRQLPLETMANMDKEKAKKVAAALGEKVQGYYLSAAAKEEEKEAWANFGLEAAQNIKAGADAGLMVTSMMGGRGALVAYQGVTGYIEGGTVEAVSRAAFFYSTPTAIAANALQGYQEEGWQKAAKNAAVAYISSKAFEYGAKKLGGSVSTQTTPSKPTVKEQFAKAQFQQARKDGESLAKAFSRAQGELDRLGKTGASAAEIIKQQKAVRDLAAAVNTSPQAKNYLKYKGDYHSQKAYNSHMKATHADVEAKFHEEMQKRGWNRQELKEFRNSASAGSVGMDHDIGLIEKPQWVTGSDGKMALNKWLTQNGKPQTVEQWQRDAQKAWDKCYHDTTGRSARQSWETVTTSMHPESYRDLNLLGADKSRAQAMWAQQSGDVTRYKMEHMLKDPSLSKLEALQEVSRGSAKDMGTKLIPLMEQSGAQGSLSQQALADAKRHWQKVQSVLDAFGQNQIDPIYAQRRIRELTGKGIPEVVNDASFLLESMIKAKK